DLTGGITWQLFDELDALGHFKCGEPRARPRDQIFGVNVGSIRLGDNRGDQLTPCIVWHTDDGDFNDIGVFVKHLFGFYGVDVFTAGNDHVVLPVDQRVKPVGVDPGHVTGVEPSAAQSMGRFFGSIPIAHEHARPAYAQFANLVDAHRLIVGVHEAEVHMIDRTPDRTGVVDDVFGLQADGDWRCRGDTVACGELQAGVLYS